MRTRLLLATATLLLGGTIALAAGRGSGLFHRLKELPPGLRADYRTREAELRAALLPTEEAVTTAGARRRARHAAPVAWGDAGTEDDDLAVMLT